MVAHADRPAPPDTRGTPRARARSPWRSGLALLALAMLAGAPLAQEQLSEPQAKAAFILNFARYVDWPERTFPSRDAPLTICLVGRDSVATALTALEGRLANGHPVALRTLGSASENMACHVVFIGASETRRLAQTLRSFSGQAILTVGDIDGFIDAGGAIGLVQGNGRLQFEVNRTALEQAQLKASSNLLKLARNLIDFKARN